MFLSFKEKVVTEASLSWLKHLSLQLHYLTGISFKVSLRITVQMNPLSSEHCCSIQRRYTGLCYWPQIIKPGERHSNSESSRCKDRVCFWASLLTGCLSDNKIVYDNWFQCVTSEKSGFHSQRCGVLVLRETF